MFSIFHTSHCGSTYLAALLSKSLPTYTEPDWSHTLHDQADPIGFIKQNTQDGDLVKFSSVYCYLMPQVEGKKVFVYRKLSSHLPKMVDCPDFPFHVERMKDHLHQKTHRLGKVTTAAEIQTALWADRMFWSIDSKDIMFVEADDLFKNPQFIARQICQFFGVLYVPLDIDFDVKAANLNHSNVPLEVIAPANVETFIEPYLEMDFEAVKQAKKMTEQFPKLQAFI